MKLLITAQGDQLSSMVDPRFGRAKYFMVVDTETGEFTAHDNTQNLNAMQGAGVQSARNALEAGAEAVVTGHVGPKAFAALLAAGIGVYLHTSGTVSETVDKFKRGELEVTRRADVEGHW